MVSQYQSSEVHESFSIGKENVLDLSVDALPTTSPPHPSMNRRPILHAVSSGTPTRSRPSLRSPISHNPVFHNSSSSLLNRSPDISPHASHDPLSHTRNSHNNPSTKSDLSDLKSVTRIPGTTPGAFGFGEVETAVAGASSVGSPAGSVPFRMAAVERSRIADSGGPTLPRPGQSVLDQSSVGSSVDNSVGRQNLLIGDGRTNGKHSPILSSTIINSHASDRRDDELRTQDRFKRHSSTTPSRPTDAQLGRLLGSPMDSLKDSCSKTGAERKVESNGTGVPNKSAAVKKLVRPGVQTRTSSRNKRMIESHKIG